MDLQRTIELFLSEKKPTTAEAYGWVLWKMAEYIGHSRPLADIKPHHLLEYAVFCDTKNWAKATKRKHIKTIKTFFNRLVALEIIEKSPATAIHAPNVSRFVSKDKAMKDDELEKLLDYLKWKPRDYALVLFLADTGCRAMGAANLKIDDVDIRKHSAIVTEKGDKTRPVWFGTRCANAIAEWKLLHPANGPYLFSRKADPIKPDNVSLIIRRACQRVGIRTLSAHSLRHRKGHQLSDNQTPPSIAATALGHSDVVTTLTHYYPVDYARAEEQIRKLATPIKFPKYSRNGKLRLTGHDLLQKLIEA